ncbi:MAG TPA: nuclear transport factor 2 family protein [Candidatus Acidoferrales bacterium]|nr:nuclear transport factor 2 family protein [Candidatus Acidoferrales bacterium]
MKRHRCFSAFYFFLTITALFIFSLVTSADSAAAAGPPDTAAASVSSGADESALLLTRTEGMATRSDRDTDQELRRSDLVLMQAIAENDAAAASTLLAPEFAWIDRDGRSRRKAELIGRLILLEAGPDTNVTIEHYGRIALIAGSHRLTPDDATALFVRVWVRQPAGWRLFLYQETTPADSSVTDARYSLPRADWQTCENPCRELPFKALSSDAQEIVASFMAGEKALFDRDAQTAGRILADDFLLVTPERAQPIDKTQRIAAMRTTSAAQANQPPTVVSMALWVFGNAAVMAADEVSSSGEKLRATRIWSRAVGQWQLAFSQQTLVQ